MRLKNPIASLQRIQSEFPNAFWTLFIATFIDRLGGALLFPFFALYVTAKFEVGMTEVGVLFALFSLANLFGSLVSGALTDKLGRKWMLIFGLVLSALSSLTMGFVDRLALFYLLAAFVGLFANTGGPAQQAMVADLLPEEQRPQGYAMIRVVANLAITIGPAIGGILAAQSYLFLFIADAISSLITAGIVFVVLPETKPQAPSDAPEPSLAQTVRGYGRALQDGTFLFFTFASVLMIIVYIQMNSSLSVFLRDMHGVSERGFGYLLSLNAGMVVAFQFWVSRRTSRQAPLVMMGLGSLLYALGFGLYGFIGSYGLFLLAMAILTVGEMIVVPIGQGLVAQMAPEDMRGRYMAIYGLTWMIPGMVGPLLAGLIMDNYDPLWVWYGAGILALVAMGGFLALHLRTGERFTQPARAAESRA